MNVLIFNCGSSSQGFKVFQITGRGKQPKVVAFGKAKNVATMTQAEAVVDWKVEEESGTETADLSSHRLAALKVLEILKDHRMGIDAIGHRFVHGGTLFERTARIDPATMKNWSSACPLLPSIIQTLAA